MFEELGFYYVGPIDGHNLEHLLPICGMSAMRPEGPILVHVVTQKGKGYAPAESLRRQVSWRLRSFDVVTGEQTKSKPNAPSYTKVFRKVLFRKLQTTNRSSDHCGDAARYRARYLRRGVSRPHL